MNLFFYHCNYWILVMISSLHTTIHYTRTYGIELAKLFGKKGEERRVKIYIESQISVEEMKFISYRSFSSSFFFDSMEGISITNWIVNYIIRETFVSVQIGIKPRIAIPFPASNIFITLKSRAKKEWKRRADIKDPGEF